MGILKKLLIVAVCLPFTGVMQASEEPSEARKDSVVLHTRIYFSRNNSEWIEKSEYRKAGDFLRWALKNPELKIHLVGWADKTGSEEINLRISARRAVTLSRYLVRKGVAAERITTEGRGIDTEAANDSMARHVDMLGLLPVALSPQPQNDETVRPDANTPEPPVQQKQNDETDQADTDTDTPAPPAQQEQSKSQQDIDTITQTEEQSSAVPQSSHSRWNIGLNVGIPFFWGDMLSMSASKTYIGTGRLPHL